MAHVLVYQSSSSSPKRPPPLISISSSSSSSSFFSSSYFSSAASGAAAAPAATRYMPQSFPTSSRSSSAAGLHQNLSDVLITEELGEQHGPVRLNSDVGSLQELWHNFRHKTPLPSQFRQHRPSRQNQQESG